MTKIALITDTHWGVRSDSHHFMDNTKKFLDEVFFPYIDEHKIEHVVHLGDIVDRRKYINFLTASRLRSDFIDPLMSRTLNFSVILGNHDIYYRETLSVNAVKELLGNYDIHIIDKPSEVSFEGTKILMIPWITEENKEAIQKAINKTKAQILFGHLELQGFEMYKGMYNDKGSDPSTLDKFDIVCSGHYHHRSISGNIHYLGSHGEFTWSDYGDDRGFHIFDTDKRELDFIPNPFTMFEKVYYDDVEKKVNIIPPQDLEGKIIKVIVKSKTHTGMFDTFISLIEKQNPIDIQVVDDHLNLDLVTDSSIVTEARDTLDIFKEYIQQANNVINSDKLDNFITSLYNEAVSLRME